MPRFAANLSMLYNELDFLDRFAAAAQDGFQGIEFLFPYAYGAHDLRQRLHDNNLTQVLFNASPGHWDSGQRGLACLSDRVNEFQSSIWQALSYADALGCTRIHVMAGIAPQGIEPKAIEATYCQNIAWAAQQAHASGCDVLIEPINTRDMPGYFLNYQAHAHRIVEHIGAPNLKVQMDLYHCQIMEGDLAAKIRQYVPTGRVGHFQIAGVPTRHEPNLGELNFPYLFDVIDEVSAACRWRGWIGCEYRPARGTAPNATHDGLGWLKAHTLTPHERAPR
jgi:hydroxypyruvate isomerase